MQCLIIKIDQICAEIGHSLTFPQESSSQWEFSEDIFPRDMSFNLN